MCSKAIGFSLPHIFTLCAVCLLVCPHCTRSIPTPPICPCFDPISDEDADRITADKLPPTATDAQKEERNATLRRIAKIAKDQGNYLLACKKYSNSGMRGFRY